MAGYYLTTQSRLTGDFIHVAFTTRSKNAKVGNVVQAWILRADRSPLDAILDGTDRAVCGQCPRRHAIGGDCYVSVKRGPQQISKSIQEGRAERLDLESPPAKLIGRVLRVGAYGDPVAVDLEIWDAVFKALAPTGWIGYTHQWRRPDSQGYREFLMASVDTYKGQFHASRVKGWRTFRARAADGPTISGEMCCPASKEGGRIASCAECQACDGLASSERPNVVIVAHGFKNHNGRVALRIGPRPERG